ncbi:MAG: hypothetical protein AAF828_01840 [Bacteroidota bacterium]
MPRMESRSKSLQRIARELDMEYLTEDQYDLPSSLGDFRLFSRGSRRRASHILRKQDGLMEFDIRIFDYRFLKWAGKRVKRYEQTVFYLHSTQLGLPEMWLQPETILHKIGELFGRGDIDFVRYPKFSGQYRLTGEDEAYIRHHFTDEVLNYFTLEKGWSLEGVGYYMVLYKKNQILGPKSIKSFYLKGMEIFKMLTNKDEQYKIYGQ